MSAAFALSLPRNIRFGRGVAGSTVEAVTALGRRPLLVHGANARRASWLMESLQAAGHPAWAIACPREPDVVLIDGRMRMACFAGVVMNVQHDTLVLFDDYIDRPNYHVIETLVKRDQTIGRMAVFKVKPKLIQEKDFLSILPWFFDLS